MTGNLAQTHTHSHFGDITKQTTRRIAISLVLTTGLAIVEAIAGSIANSLALLTDAAHNFTDIIALGLSWYALGIAVKPANSGNTFGYHRAGILVALVNSTTLILIAAGIFHEAYHRISSPPEIDSPILIGIGMLAFLTNAGTAWLLRSGSVHDLNLRSAFLHLVGDVLSTLGAVAAGVAIFFTQWNWLDPLVSFFIGGLILWNAWGILRQAIHILLESTPESIDMKSMVDDLLEVNGVRGVHDLHVWSINDSLRILSAHVMTEDISISAGSEIQRGINGILLHKYNIQHATLQLECEGCNPGLLFCDMTEHSRKHTEV